MDEGSSNGLAATSVVDERLNINQLRQIVVQLGTPSYTVFKSPANSATSTSNINWMIQPPKGNVLDSRLLITFYVQIVFDAKDNTITTPPLMDIGNTDACRAFPIHSVLETAQLELNGTTFSYNPIESIAQLGLYIGDDDRTREFSGTGAYPDQFQDYRDPVTYGTARNPLGKYGDNSAYVPRGSIEYKVVYSEVNNSRATVTFEVTEPLMISPALFTTQVGQPGFVGLNQLRIVLKTGNLQRIWSRSATGTRTLTDAGPTVTFTSAPMLTYTVLTLNPTLAAFNPNSHYYYPYFQVTTQTWSGQNGVASKADVTLVGNAITLSFIPIRMYIYVREKGNNRSIYTSDSEFRINSVTIQIENTVGILSTATSFDIYKISAQNGLNLDYQGWSRFRGSVACFQFGKDLPLRDNLAVGMQHNFQFSATVNATNISGRQIDCDVFYTWVTPGMVDIFSGKCDATSNLVDAQNVIMSRSNPYSHSLASYDRTLPFGGAMMMGGGFFGNLFSGIKKGIGYAANLLPQLATAVAPVHSGLGSVLGTVGKVAQVGNNLLNPDGSGLVFGSGMYGGGASPYHDNARIYGGGLIEDLKSDIKQSTSTPTPTPPRYYTLDENDPDNQFDEDSDVDDDFVPEAKYTSTLIQPDPPRAEIDQETGHLDAPSKIAISQVRLNWLGYENKIVLLQTTMAEIKKKYEDGKVHEDAFHEYLQDYKKEYAEVEGLLEKQKAMFRKIMAHGIFGTPYAPPCDRNPYAPVSTAQSARKKRKSDLTLSVVEEEAAN